MSVRQTGSGSTPSSTRSIRKRLATMPAPLPDPNQDTDIEAFTVEIHEQLKPDRDESPKVAGAAAPMVQG